MCLSLPSYLHRLKIISLLSDYPSLGHIAHVARENSVSIIWAVTSAHISLYSR